MKVLILGVTGMFGHTLYKKLYKNDLYDTFGTARRIDKSLIHFFEGTQKNILEYVDAEKFQTIIDAIDKTHPDIIINCIGIIKQLEISKQHIPTIKINALFPHQLAEICSKRGVRLIHISTDCVFKGDKGHYLEKDIPDATDLYGRTKSLGEITYGDHLTLRTSIIGHELKSHLSLVDWFVGQRKEIEGFEKAIYSGLPTVELVEVIEKYILCNDSLKGLYHVSSDLISKNNLLKMIAKTYGKKITIKPNRTFVLDHSLDSSLFREATGYSPPSWDELIEKMHKNYLKEKYEII